MMKCRRLVVWLAPMALAVGSAGALSDPTTNKLSSDDKTYVERVHRTLSSLYLMDASHKDLLTGTDRGGELYGFSAHGQLVVLTVRIGFSDRLLVTTFFYRDGALYGRLKEVFSLPMDHSKHINRDWRQDGPFQREMCFFRSDDGVVVDAEGRAAPTLPSRQDLIREAIFYQKCLRSQDKEPVVESFVKEGKEDQQIDSKAMLQYSPSELLRMTHLDRDSRRQPQTLQNAGGGRRAMIHGQWSSQLPM